jgi:hypothetical protein
MKHLGLEMEAWEQGVCVCARERERERERVVRVSE